MKNQAAALAAERTQIPVLDSGNSESAVSDQTTSARQASGIPFSDRRLSQPRSGGSSGICDATGELEQPQYSSLELAGRAGTQGDSLQDDAASVDQLEIEKFNKLASTWWDASGPMWPLHTLNSLRSTYIREHIVEHFNIKTDSARPLEGLRILDIGCGGGLLSEAMAGKGAEVHGVDISDGNIVAATLHAQSMSQPPVYELTTAEALYQRSEAYDVVLNLEVVEHVADLSSFMRACSGLVKPGGLQIVSTINRNPVSYISAIIGAEYILKWLPRGTHQYKRLVKPSELETLLERDHLTSVASTGVLVNPFTRNMSLGRSKLINYMMVAEKPVSAYL